MMDAIWALVSPCDASFSTCAGSIGVFFRPTFLGAFLVAAFLLGAFLAGAFLAGAFLVALRLAIELHRFPSSELLPSSQDDITVCRRDLDSVASALELLCCDQCGP